MSEILELGGLVFHVRRSARRRTVALVVDRAAELIVNSPESVTADELSRWVNSKLLWVHRKLALKSEVASRGRTPEYVPGESFLYLGKRYRLRLMPDQRQDLHFDGTAFLLRRNAQPADELFRQWYIQTGRRWLKRRLPLLNRLTGVSPARVVVRDLGFRWGSCGRDKSINLNWRVFQLPVALIDYLLLHELCHIEEPSHGPKFWRALDRTLPEWRQRRETLNRLAREIYWCSPEEKR